MTKTPHKESKGNLYNYEKYKKIWNEAFHLGYFQGLMVGLVLVFVIYLLLEAVK